MNEKRTLIKDKEGHCLASFHHTDFTPCRIQIRNCEVHLNSNDRVGGVHDHIALPLDTIQCL